MDKKIFWDEKTGTVYWLEDGDVHFAPMNLNNTCHLDEGGIVDDWESDEEKIRITALI